MNKRWIVKTIKAHKFVSGVLGLILSIAGVWALYKGYCRKDISGQWKLTFKNETSLKKSYVGETHTQKVFFTQSETEIEGHGEKWEYNGELLPFEAHRKLEYKGAVDENEFKATYVLHGLKRVSEGMIHVTINDDGNYLEGKFSGTAGETAGTVTGQKID